MQKCLEMITPEWNETAVCARVPLKVSLCESSERLTFTAPAESIMKSNQRMLAKGSKLNYVRRKELRIWLHPDQSAQKVKFNFINWPAGRCNLEPVEHAGLIIISEWCMQLTFKKATFLKMPNSICSPQTLQTPSLRSLVLRNYGAIYFTQIQRVQHFLWHTLLMISAITHPHPVLAHSYVAALEFMSHSCNLIVIC